MKFFSLDARGYERFKKHKLTENQGSHTRLDKKLFWRYNNYLKKEYNFDMETCSECGIQEWNGKPVIMELDHLNGITDDARIENLSMKCPNCHSQTHNYKNRKVTIFEKKKQLVASVALAA